MVVVYVACVVGVPAILERHRHRLLTVAAVHHLTAVPVSAVADVRFGSCLIKLSGLGIEPAVGIALPLACVPRTKEAGVLCALVVGGLVLLRPAPSGRQWQSRSRKRTATRLQEKGAHPGG